MKRSEKAGSLLNALLKRLGWPVMALVICAPIVGQCWLLSEERGEFSRLLGSADTLAERGRRLNAQFNECNGMLTAMRARTVGEQGTASIQNDLIAIARKSGCQLRYLKVRESSHRPWQDDDHLSIEHPAGGGWPTGYELHSHPVSMAVVGNLPSVLNFLGQAQAHSTFKLIKRSHLSHDESSPDDIALQLELVFFGFRRVPPESTDAAIPM